jgi:DNA-binding IclR family transcriptional regulator
VRNSEAPHARSIERTFAILEILDRTKRGWNISELGRKLNIPKSSAHVIITTLERLGYVKREAASRRYQLCLKVYGLGRNLLRNLAVPDLALPHLRALTEKTKLTSHLGVLEKDQIVFIQKVDGPGFIKFDTYIGKRAGLHCTSLGKSFLAYASDEVIEEILSLSSFGRYTRKTITKPSDLRAAISHVRSKGYSLDDEEEELGVRCIGAPVLNQFGEPVAAVSVTGTVFQIQPHDFETIAASVKQAAARVSRALQRS